jgi:hypothetical protein
MLARRSEQGFVFHSTTEYLIMELFSLHSSMHKSVQGVENRKRNRMAESKNTPMEKGKVFHNQRE